ncbi:O-acetylhomoserine aminocarboxypropyltransferase/cysteine synthase family protein [Desulfatitalea alkaliphila]|uniref:O-acetylhomoserine aminocarboxypropyltransferase/cysteine synthase n=1 Tax=Desulfatitalea alkaliphila TaxID=2929485 RepID=A0AA41R1K5_9BACT|nr:O-acetylhomoserine aminocarboxypropyltransferase/cysteine synthase [Desulfatitalea alkaliphila]MCJ8499106.1 O-acetylhomoserine aminocarboxypropyltransferase/cysteine synthase [Desulfatitalea alkaliphila]
MTDTYKGFSTTAIHGGHTPDSDTRSRAVPLYQTTSYTFEDTTHAADLFGLRKFGNIYTRIMNPTTDVLEQRVAALEGGVGALATASGQAAETLTILTLAAAGDEIVASTDLYGGTVSLFAHTLPKLGITVRFVPPNDFDAWEKAVNGKTKAFFVESIGNPKLDIVDIGRLADIGKAHGVPLVVDNTVTSPYLLRPFEHGAAVVVHSATKFIGGHGTSIGGIIVDSGKFDWAGSGRFASFLAPDPAYHGLKFVESFGELAFILRARVLGLRDMGAAISPFNAWLLLQGLETLALRMERHSANGLAVARWLQQHPCVEWVRYPGLPESPTYDLLARYLPKGQGALVGFGIKGGRDAAVKFIESCRLFSHLANIGDAKSLVIHPASTTHEQLTAAEQQAAGVTPDFIRLSVGIEDIDDILADLDQALQQGVGCKL